MQLELPPRVRGTSPLFWDWEGPGLNPHTQALVDALVDAVITWNGRDVGPKAPTAPPANDPAAPVDRNRLTAPGAR